MNVNRTWKSVFAAAALSTASFAPLSSRPVVPTEPEAKAIYVAKCAKCHGSDGTGVEKYKKKGVKDFTDANWQKTRSNAQLTAAVKDGKGEVMPSWKAKLSDAEIKALVALVRSFKK